MLANVIVAAVLAAPAPTPRPTPTPPPLPAVAVLKHAGGPASHAAGRSLADVARRTRLKTGAGTVISDSNLAELARGVELTEAQSLPDDARPAASASTRDEGRRSLWQQRYQQARGRVVFLEGEVERLEEEVAGLQSQFYAWDDPAYRDGVIKPAWDKAVADLGTTRDKLEQARTAPDDVLAEASRDGALPGWFRGLGEPEPVSDEAMPAPTPVATPVE